MRTRALTAFAKPPLRWLAAGRRSGSSSEISRPSQISTSRPSGSRPPAMTPQGGRAGSTLHQGPVVDPAVGCPVDLPDMIGGEVKEDAPVEPRYARPGGACDGSGTLRVVLEQDPPAPQLDTTSASWFRRQRRTRQAWPLAECVHVSRGRVPAGLTLGALVGPATGAVQGPRIGVRVLIKEWHVQPHPFTREGGEQ